MLQHLPLVQLPTTTPSSYPLAVVSFSLTTFHSNNSCSNLALGLYSDPWNYNLFSAPSSLENGSGGGGYIIRDNICRRLLLAVPLVDQRLRETGFYLLIFRCGGLFLTRRGTTDSRTQRITDSLHQVMTTATMAMALDPIINSHIPLAVLSVSSNFLFPPNVDYHPVHVLIVYQFLSPS